MPFVLKQIDNFKGDEAPPAKYFPGTVRIGSKDDCDLVLKSKKVLPFHAEIYHRGNEYRFVAAQHAFVELNDSEVLKWPAVLSSDDILTIGDTKLQFNTIPAIPRRSWRAGFTSFLAVAVLVLLIIFEVAIMIWLPYTLHRSKSWALAAAKQDVVMQIDRLRAKTRGLPTENESQLRIKTLLIDCEDSIANYVREYRLQMNQEQTRSVHKSLTQLEIIASHWTRDRNKYAFKENINLKRYIDKLCSDLKIQNNTPISKP